MNMTLFPVASSFFEASCCIKKSFIKSSKKISNKKQKHICEAFSNKNDDTHSCTYLFRLRLVICFSNWIEDSVFWLRSSQFSFTIEAECARNSISFSLRYFINNVVSIWFALRSWIILLVDFLIHFILNWLIKFTWNGMGRLTILPLQCCCHENSRDHEFCSENNLNLVLKNQ